VGGSNTLLSITNEKGNAEITIYTEDEGTLSIEGTPIGQAVLNDNWIIFTAGAASKIYKLWFGDKDNIGIKDTLYGKCLHTGALGFSVDNPIETLTYYENEDVQKVYWTDGLNQPRVINIAKSSFNDTDFDFVPTLTGKEAVTITRLNTGSGIFASGVIQYVCTYYNNNGQESNAFYTSPLYYITDLHKGKSPEDTAFISFGINIDNLNKKFDYVRIYSIHRSSLNSTPECKRVIDIETNTESNSITYVDNGAVGDSIDPTILLYLGGEKITAGTISQKDGTLFLGNIEQKTAYLKEELKEAIKGQAENIQWTTAGDSEAFTPIFANVEAHYPLSIQLSNTTDIESIKTFKRGEYYRLGLQFQYNTGKWSDVVFLKDSENTVAIETSLSTEDNAGVKYPYAQLNLDLTQEVTMSDGSKKTIHEFLYREGIVKVRPVVVYPTIADRTVICQGLLCPTVYNVKDREDNSPFVQSSWFTRPNAPKDIKNNDDEFTNIGNSEVSNGKWVEFRHNFAVPGCCFAATEDNSERTYNNFELSYNSTLLPPIFQKNTISTFANNYYIDHSIVTLHSPDIEFDESLYNADLSNVRLRIVGYVPFTSNYSDINIIADKKTLKYKNKDTQVPGFYKEGINNNGISTHGWRGIAAYPMWIDRPNGTSSTTENLVNFAVYPWQSENTLNNGDGSTSILTRKVMSSLRVSLNTKYFNSDKIIDYKLSDTKVFNNSELSILKLKAPVGAEVPEFIYQGNVDKVIANPFAAYGVAKDRITQESSKIYHNSFSDKIVDITGLGFENPGNILNENPVRIKYKSTPHAVLSLDRVVGDLRSNSTQVILPTKTGENLIYDYRNYSNEDHPFWDSTLTSINQQQIDFTSDYGYLWVGELYRDQVLNRFGGTSNDALNNNTWLPCGEAKAVSGDKIELKWVEGDTYYQRYDHLKTYPFTQEDKNSVVDVVSFMCETRVNIDGRYDKNVGLLSNLYTTPENFNKINKVYSQPNNFFNYRTTYGNLSLTNKFNNVITWTKTKVAGELTDSWTNITLASILELDGELGPVNAIRRFNNNLLAFQDKGISQILYNENVQIASTEGVPIEIANSGKVSGKRYITNQIGCHNKWSICESPNGLYFIDDINKGIYVFDGSLNNISTKLGFDTWVKSTVNLTTWNPNSFSNFITYYDKSNRDILFINNETCLAYSEVLGQFTSFYDYDNVPLISNINNKTLMFKNNKIWGHNEGNYNSFFGNNKPFYTTLIANPDMSKDKIFNTVEFRSDTWDNIGTLSEDTFDKLEVWNEYQRGEASLVFNKNMPSTLKRKFRIWRANIPRDESNGRDRIRNPWAYIKLSKNNNLNNTKTVLHDVIVSYFY
jgi:hypothetical protein